MGENLLLVPSITVVDVGGRDVATDGSLSSVLLKPLLQEPPRDR